MSLDTFKDKKMFLEKDSLEQFSQNLNLAPYLIDNLPIHYPGDTFGIVGENTVKAYFVEADGELALTKKVRTFPLENFEDEPVQKPDITMAEVISFDDNSVVARVYFNESPSKRKFKKSFVNMLKKLDLLYQGALFNIVSKENDDELSIKLEKCSENISPEIQNLYAKIAESIDKEC